MQLFETELIKWMTKGTERRTLGAFCRQSEAISLIEIASFYVASLYFIGIRYYICIIKIT